MPVVFVSGALANKYHNGGEAWVRLNWIRGFQRLGWQVVFIEQISPDTCVDEQGRQAAFESCVNRCYFTQVVDAFGLSDSAALVFDYGRQIKGMSFASLQALADSAELLINISGHLDWPPIFERIRHRVYVDIDPGFTQFWHEEATAGARLSGHHAFVTIGLNIGSADCLIPSCGLHWNTVLPPIVLADWQVRSTLERNSFTTIANWRGPFGVIERQGRTFGLKVHEFRKFIELPRKCALPFQIALAIHPSDQQDRQRLVNAEWQLIEPSEVAANPFSFRDYVSGSLAEFSVAQGIYVDTNSGWFSDRTVAYLAAGRPVLVQDTGFSRHLPVGEGLVCFRSMDEAIAGARDIVDRYEHHRRAARRIAEFYCDSDRVISKLLNDLKTSP